VVTALIATSYYNYVGIIVSTQNSAMSADACIALIIAAVNSNASLLGINNTLKQKPS
jgi:hypothetical protein